MHAALIYLSVIFIMCSGKSIISLSMLLLLLLLRKAVLMVRFILHLPTLPTWQTDR